jgi:PPM family protein phosphatase
MAALTAWAALSATGQVRKVNEDSAYAGQWLYAVADGMGGHVAGDVASAEVIRSLAALDTETDSARLAHVLSSGVGAANAALRQRTDREPGLRTMGTTLTAMLWSGHSYALAHIGDSRAYRLRGGQLRQLTEDHALGNLVSGAATIDALAPIMSRFLDGRPDRSPDLDAREARSGDRYLLCSDGLTAVVPDSAIRDALSTTGSSLTGIAGQLADLAEREGSPDNVTLIVIDVNGTQTRDQPLRLGAASRI